MEDIISQFVVNFFRDFSENISAILIGFSLILSTVIISLVIWCAEKT